MLFQTWEDRSRVQMKKHMQIDCKLLTNRKEMGDSFSRKNRTVKKYTGIIHSAENQIMPNALPEFLYQCQ
jgi:hypothetical protein